MPLEEVKETIETKADEVVVALRRHGRPQCFFCGLLLKDLHSLTAAQLEWLLVDHETRKRKVMEVALGSPIETAMNIKSMRRK